MAKDEEYDLHEHLKILNQFYLDVIVALGLQKKKKSRIEELEKILKKTNKLLWPVMLLAVKEDQPKKQAALNEEILNQLKGTEKRKRRKHRKYD
jgi:hypothetical protein